MAPALIRYTYVWTLYLLYSRYAIIWGSHRTTGRVWTLGEADKLIIIECTMHGTYPLQRSNTYMDFVTCIISYCIDNDDNGLYNIDS